MWPLAAELASQKTFHSQKLRSIKKMYGSYLDFESKTSFPNYSILRQTGKINPKNQNISAWASFSIWRGWRFLLRNKHSACYMDCLLLFPKKIRASYFYMLQRWGIFDQLSELTEQTNINWLSSLQFNLQPVFQYSCIIISRHQKIKLASPHSDYKFLYHCSFLSFIKRLIIFVVWVV